MLSSHRVMAALASMFLWASASALPAHERPPNILFVLTDDQDVLLDSMAPDGPCQTILRELGTKGATFTNAFVNTPICCPSRAEITTGRYMHNTKVFDNSCGGEAFIEGAEKHNVAAELKAVRPEYRTFYAGKYLNNYGSPKLGGVSRVPAGWDEWYGLVGNSKYYDYVVSNNGVAERHGNDYHADYFTDRVANRSLDFMRKAFNDEAPFFMTVATPASHSPNTPAPQYAETYAGRKAPRLPSYNVTGQPNKHYLLREIIPMDAGHANVSDVYFQRRWSVLRSVDDMVGRFVNALTAAGQLSNTYIMYTSDHGYHLGEFGMLYDKRMLYETDIRVPLLVRGPGIRGGQKVDMPVAHIDLAPTILAFAGVDPPAMMDGRPWNSLVAAASDNGAAAATAAGSWRTEFMVEYSGGNPLPNRNKMGNEWGAGDRTVIVDVQAEEDAFAGSIPLVYHAHRRSSCSASADNEMSLTGKCSCSIGRITGNEHDVSPCDGRNNTYACVRTLGGGKNEIYCEFNDPEGFREYYNLDVDPYNLHNLVAHTSPAKLEKMHRRLLKHQACSGRDCFNPQ